MWAVTSALPRVLPSVRLWVGWAGGFPLVPTGPLGNANWSQPAMIAVATGTTTTEAAEREAAGEACMVGVRPEGPGKG